MIPPLIHLHSENLGASTCEVSFAQRELARERQKAAHYQARVESLSTRLATQNAELMKSMESHSLDKKKLETTEEQAQRAEQQIMLMKRKVHVYIKEYRPIAITS